MNITLPADFLNKEDWDRYLIDQVPVLGKLWTAGEYEKFETYKALAGYTYAEYQQFTLSTLYHEPYIPIVRRTMTKSISSIVVDVQPMSAPAGGIF